MASILALAAAVFGSLFKGKRALVLENLALRQQLADESCPVDAGSAVRVIEVRGMTLLVEGLPPEESF